MRSFCWSGERATISCFHLRSHAMRPVEFWLHIHFAAYFDYIATSLVILITYPLHWIFWLHIHFAAYFDYISTSLDILITYPLHWIFWLYIHFTGYFDFISTSLDILITYPLYWIFWLHIHFAGYFDYISTSLDILITYILHWIIFKILLFTLLAEASVVVPVESINQFGLRAETVWPNFVLQYFYHLFLLKYYYRIGAGAGAGAEISTTFWSRKMKQFRLRNIAVHFMDPPCLITVCNVRIWYIKKTFCSNI